MFTITVYLSESNALDSDTFCYVRQNFKETSKKSFMLVSLVKKTKTLKKNWVKKKKSSVTEFEN